MMPFMDMKKFVSDRGRCVFTAIYLGSLMTMLLSGYLAEAGGWPLIFYSFGGASIAWFVPWVILAYDSPEQHPGISKQEKEYIMTGLGREQINKEDKVQILVPWRNLITSAPVWAAITMHFGVTWVLNTFLAELPTYTKNILHFDIKKNGLVSALPYLANLLSSVGFGFLSQWLRSRDLLSHLTAYRVFNGISAMGPAVALLVITLVGCDTTIIVILLVLTMALRGAFFGGSYVNHMDLAVNHTGALSGLLHTVINLSGILSPLVTGALTKGQQTLAQWQIVFYISIVIVLVPYLVYLVFGSVEEQLWNKPRRCSNQQFTPKYTQSTHF